MIRRPANLFQLELTAALSGRGAVLMRVGLTLLLGLPFLLAAMPPRIRVAGLVMIIIFTGFFGAAVGRVRARSDGRSSQLILLPISRVWLVVDSTLAGTVVDMLQSGPLVILLAIFYSQVRAVSFWAPLAGLYLGLLFGLNLLGRLLGNVVHRNQDVHLFGALLAGILAFISGLFPVPDKIALVVESIRPYNPIALVFDGLYGSVRGGVLESWSSADYAGMALLIIVAGLIIHRMKNGFFPPAPAGQHGSTASTSRYDNHGA